MSTSIVSNTSFTIEYRKCRANLNFEVQHGEIVFYLGNR